MAIALLAGFTVGLSPSASAHKDTNTVAVVEGEVSWPGPLPKHGDVCPTWDTDPLLCTKGTVEGFDLPRGIADWNLSLDLRANDPANTLPAWNPATQEGIKGAPLNGCRLKDGNSAAGLPLGTLGGPANPPDPMNPTEKGEPRTFDNHDLCFAFTGFVINAAGWWENRLHATLFDCAASGTSGSTGAGGLGEDPTNPGTAVGLGAFYGEFVCDGSPSSDLPAVPRADGHFHGLTAAGTTIAFLGVVHCTGEKEEDPKGNLDECPRTIGTSDPKFDNSPNAKDLSESRIKHTLACKGEVVPTQYVDKHNSFLDDVSQEQLGTAVLSAQVELECVIA